MRAASWVAASVFRESIRNRVGYNLVLFAVLLIGSSFLLGQLTAGQDIKIIKDLGLAATALFGLFIALFIGIGLVSTEIDRRSIYALLAKPVSRAEFVIGKFAGLALTLGVNLLVMTAALYLVLGCITWTTAPDVRAVWDAPGPDPRLLIALFLIFMELMLVTAVALFFSTFSSPMLSAALTFGVYLAGHFNTELRALGELVTSRPATLLLRGLYHVLPDLSAFDVKTQIVHGLPVGAGYVLSTAVYGLAYMTCLLLAATVIFARRDFK